MLEIYREQQENDKYLLREYSTLYNYKRQSQKINFIFN